MSRRNKNGAKRVLKPRNQALAAAMREVRRSSAAEPHRNRARYSRNDERAMRQRGWK